MRPREARYQAALRPDMIDFNSSLLCELVAKTLRWATLATGLDSEPDSNRLVFGIAHRLEVTFDALRFSRLADAPAMPNQLMREQDPFLLRNYLH